MYDDIIFPSIVKLFEQTIRFRDVRIHGNNTVQDDIGNIIVRVCVLIEKRIENTKRRFSIRRRHEKHEMTRIAYVSNNNNIRVVNK